MAASHRVDPDRWRSVLGEVMAKVAGRFSRVEPRATARAFVAGLLSEAERKNCWSLAEHCGYRRPDAMQRLLRSARWDADAVRDDLRDLVVERLGDPDGVLIVDETGFLKKGGHSAGVQRQYSGTAGRIENSQIGVLATTAPTTPGHQGIDLTANEIRHLMNALILDQPRSPARVLHWSIWRRTHQGRARHSHYQRRLAT